MALCLVPLLMRAIPLSMRAECGVAGFIALDLFQMLSQQLCRKMGAPTGSTFWAGQTVSNLQHSCLSGVLLCAVKDASFNPWLHSGSRLTELGVEEQFAFLRSQASNSQLTSRGYFKATARTQLRAGSLLEKEKAPPAQGEPALNPEELLGISCDFFP